MDPMRSGDFSTTVSYRSRWKQAARSSWSSSIPDAIHDIVMHRLEGELDQEELSRLGWSG